MRNKWCVICSTALTSRQRYCSAACKQKAYRRRIEAEMKMTAIPRYVRTGCESCESPGGEGCRADCPTLETSQTVTNSNGNVTRSNAEEVIYLALVDALYHHAARGGTAQGALLVAQRVFLAHGVGLARLRLPRLTPAQLKELGIGKRSPYWWAGKVRSPQEYERLKLEAEVNFLESLGARKPGKRT